MKKYLAIVLFALPVTITAQQAVTPLMISVRINTSVDNSVQNRYNPMATPVMTGIVDRMYATAYFKGHMQKKELEYGGAKYTTIYNSRTSTSAVLKQVKGERTGYIQTEAQRVGLLLRNDSIMKAQEEAMLARVRYNPDVDSADTRPDNRYMKMNTSGTVAKVELSSKTKKINGIHCKKAIVTIAYASGEKDKMDVWYTDEYKLPPGVTNTLGGPLGLSAIEGIPVRYRYSIRQSFYGYDRTRTVQYEVRSIDTGRTIHDHVFEIPPTYTVKTWEQYIKDNPAQFGTFQGLTRRRDQ